MAGGRRGLRWRGRDGRGGLCRAICRATGEAICRTVANEYRLGWRDVTDKRVRPTDWKSFCLRYRQERAIQRKYWPFNWRHSLLLVAGFLPVCGIFAALQWSPSILAILMMAWMAFVFTRKLEPRQKPPRK